MGQVEREGGKRGRRSRKEVEGKRRLEYGEGGGGRWIEGRGSCVRKEDEG